MLCVAAAGLLFAAGCRGHPKPPARVAVGAVRVGTAARPRSAQLRACLRRYHGDIRLSAETRVVERRGRLGASLTIAVPRSQLLFGCDFVRRRTAPCGGAVGVWRRNRLNDPRLDILCADRKGHLGAAWVVPLPRARSIAVREGDRIDVYPVAGRLPVRIWTRDGVDVARSSADFDVSQLARGGRELARERLRAFVAG